jgi:hypothetical protein
VDFEFLVHAILFELAAVKFRFHLQPLIVSFPYQFHQADGILKSHRINRGGHLMELDGQA